jgi:A/G-specific adenine glycosylase
VTPRHFRRELLAWYDSNFRSLPWRESTDFYGVWLSEIMLQQTRVEAAIPYYLRFREQFPTLEALAAAPEPAVLAAWSGLGYYSRARNLHKAARLMAANGVPGDYPGILALPGVGPYTAAAIASIVLGERHAAVDGNVVRVISRLTNGEAVTAMEATRLLDPHRPGDFNQAMMELGATVCIPRTPRCEQCPVVSHCEGRAAGRERELPVRPPKPPVRDVPLDLLVFNRQGSVFLMQRAASEKRLAGFWELPQTSHFPEVVAEPACEFTHRIVNDRFRVAVWTGPTPRKLADGHWFTPEALSEIPLSTITRKALHLVHNFPRSQTLKYAQ